MRKYLLLILAIVLIASPAFAIGSKKSLHKEISASIVIANTTSTDNTPVVGTIIDTRGFGATEFIIVTGVIADNASTLTPSLESCEASNCSDAAAVTGRLLAGTIAAASFNGTEDSTVKYLGYLGTRRYLRLTVTPGIASSSAIFRVIAIQGYPLLRPLR
jgi:ABC-type iron transport system FetAB permease component